MAKKKKKENPATEMAGTPDAEQAPKSKTRKMRKEEPQSDSLREWVKSIVIAVVLFLFLRTFIVQTFVITSGSMEETLLVGDMLVVNRLALGSRIPGTKPDTMRSRAFMKGGRLSAKSMQCGSTRSSQSPMARR